MVKDIDLYQAYAGLLTLATTTIYAGAWSSLSPVKPSSTKRSPFEDDNDDDEDQDVQERLSSSEAWLFPVFGSAVLGSFYLVFIYYGKEWINWLLGIYFSIAGAASFWKSSVALTRWTVGDEKWKSYEKIKFLILIRTREFGSLSIRLPSLILILPSTIPSIIFLLSGTPKPALITNILAVSFAQNALSLLKLDGFMTGCILLSGLFVYDVWWVFGTKVMVTVAKGLDVPIKLLWPKSLDFSASAGHSMLGLGDVVIPGTFIALALRYDQSRAPAGARKYPTPYFNAAMIAYVLGLVTTMVVMHVFKAAQPALLYLSPACILSFLITAASRSELKQAFKWKDEAPSAAQPEISTDKLPVLEPREASDSPTKADNEKPVETLTTSKTGDDFVNVEKEEGGDDSEGAATKRKRPKKKKA